MKNVPNSVGYNVGPPGLVCCINGKKVRVTDKQNQLRVSSTASEFTRLLRNEMQCKSEVWKLSNSLQTKKMESCTEEPIRRQVSLERQRMKERQRLWCALLGSCTDKTWVRLGR